MDQKAGRIYRITRRTDIRRVFDAGLSVRDRILTIVAAPNDLPRARFGVGVSKRHGSAVRRNCVKRLCREAFRLSRDAVPPGWDYMILPRPGAPLTLDDLRISMVMLAKRVAQSDGAAAGPGQQEPPP